MALKAGYYGIKKKLFEQIRNFSNVVFPRSEQGILGAKNLLPNLGTSGTLNGVTWVVSGDGTVTANGTKDSSSTGFKILDRGRDNYSLPTGKYIFSGNPGENCNMMLQATRGGSLVDLGSILGTTKEVVVNIESTDILQCVLFVVAGKTVTNVVFKPMLRLASDPDDTYVPYAKTNRELTLASSSGGGLDYSTTEQDTGLTWVDGKKIYQRTFHKQNASSGDVVLDDDLQIDTLISAEGVGFTSDSLLSLPIYKTSSTYFRVEVYPNSPFTPYRPIASLTYNTIPEFYVTLKYTKRN